MVVWDRKIIRGSLPHFNSRGIKPKGPEDLSKVTKRRNNWKLDLGLPWKLFLPPGAKGNDSQKTVLSCFCFWRCRYHVTPRVTFSELVNCGGKTRGPDKPFSFHLFLHEILLLLKLYLSHKLSMVLILSKIRPSVSDWFLSACTGVCILGRCYFTWTWKD